MPVPKNWSMIKFQQVLEWDYVEIFVLHIGLRFLSTRSSMFPGCNLQNSIQSLHNLYWGENKRKKSQSKENLASYLGSNDFQVQHNKLKRSLKKQKYQIFHLEDHNWFWLHSCIIPLRSRYRRTHWSYWNSIASLMHQKVVALWLSHVIPASLKFARSKIKKPR